MEFFLLDLKVVIKFVQKRHGIELVGVVPQVDSNIFYLLEGAYYKKYNNKDALVMWEFSPLHKCVFIYKGRRMHPCCAPPNQSFCCQKND